MRTKVCAYFDNFDPAQFPEELLNRWHDSWGEHGFDTYMLSEHDARVHPKYGHVCSLIDKLPTVNQRAYERACWLRWLAYWTEAPALFTDIDVINYGFKPEQIKTDYNFTATEAANRDLISYQTYPGPAAVWATRNALDRFINFFDDAHLYVDEVGGKPHISDMYLFRIFYEGKATAQMWDCCYPYSMEVPLVHFGNACVRAEHRGKNRHLAVDEFTQQRKELYELRSAHAG